MHIKIDLKIFAIFALFCLTMQVKIYVLLMIFTVLHELGHILAGIMLGLKPKSIGVNSFRLVNNL